MQQVAHHSFLAVNKKAVEQFGDKWTEAANIVTNGPFKLERWEHNSAIDIVKDDEWRGAADVKLTRVNGRMISDGITAVQAFEAGEVDVLYQGLPPDEIPRLKETPEYEQYPALGTYYYGVNVKNITDVNQRRAMALAIPRQSIIDNVAQADQLPADRVHAGGHARLRRDQPGVAVAAAEGDMEQAKELMSEVANPKTDITLYINDSPGHREIAVAIQAAWKELGITSTIKQQEFQQYLEFLGPPPNQDVDVYRLGWIGDFVDAINFLELWTCESGNNNTNFCNEEYDAADRGGARHARTTTPATSCTRQAEEILFGEDGEMPVLPIYFYTYVEPGARDRSRTPSTSNLLDQIDLTKVVVTE